MDLELKNKVAFVAGSSRGIGKAIASRFLQEGARVVISGREAESLEMAARQFYGEFGYNSVMPIIGDMTDPVVIRSSLNKTIEKWGSIDCAVANIGNGTASSGWPVEAAEWTSTFHTNFLSACLLINEVMPQLIQGGNSSLVIVSSIVGIEATTAPLAYSSAKSALTTYGKNLARLVASKGVRVNLVAPGNVAFPGGSWEKRMTDSPDAVNQYIKAEVPMTRFGRPEEIADFVVFLCSARASFATGMCAIVDGGQTRTI